MRMPLIRLETQEDNSAVRHVNEQAFHQENEATLVDRLRLRGVLTVSLVAVGGGKVIGHIAFSPVTIGPEPAASKALTLAPVAVLPEQQRQGVGSQLVRAGLEECRRLEYEIVVVVGHPEYYPRFGFVPAQPKGLICEFEVPDPAWMVMELRPGALAEKRGIVGFQTEFREAM
jgi:putative acetyltransferase